MADLPEKSENAAPAPESGVDEGVKGQPTGGGEPIQKNPLAEWEPPVRKSPLDYIKERKEWQLNKQKSKEIDELDSQIEEENDDDKDIGRRIQSEVSKVLEPVGRFLQESADNAEINDFLLQPENAVFKKYEAQAKRYVKAHPNLPARSIFRDLAFDDAQALGAERSDKAKMEAKKQSAGGASRRANVGGSELPDFSKMSAKEIDKFNLSLRGKSYDTE